MNKYPIAIQTINAADLTDKLKINAFALLGMVHQDNGHLTCSMQKCQERMGRVSWKTARNRLSLLSKAKVLHYSHNEFVDITFEAWRNPDSKGLLSRVDGTPVPYFPPHPPE